MNTRLVNSAAGVIQAAQAKDRTAAGIALALESAALLMSPEVAAELERLRARVAELEAERHVTNEALDDAVQALRASKDQPAPLYVSRPLPPRDAVCARPGCGHAGSEHHHGDTKCWANLPRTREPNGTWSAVPICDCAGFVAETAPDGITRLIAPTQALREDDDPARCLKVHPFSPRDGWRMVCGNCDHGKDASCHGDGA